MEGAKALRIMRGRVNIETLAYGAVPETPDDKWKSLH